MNTRTLRSIEHLLLYVIVATLPLQAVALIPGTTLTLTKPAGALLILCVLVRRVIDRDCSAMRTRLEGALALFAAACALSIPASAHPGEARAAFLTLLTYLFIFYAVAGVSANESVQRWVPRVYVASASLSGIAALAGLAGWVTPTVDTLIPNSNIRRLCVGMTDANDQALLYLFAIAFLLFAPDDDESGRPARRRGAERIVATVLVMAGLVLSMSRSGWVCAGLLLAARGLFGRNRLRFIAGVMLGVAIVVAGLAAIRPDILARAGRRVTEVFRMNDLSVASRILHDTSAIDRARAGGLFGHGLGATLNMRLRFTDPLGAEIPCTVHNVPLIVWLDSGWVGLLAFGWLWSCIIVLLYVAWRAAPDAFWRRQLLMYAAMLAVYAVIAMVMPLMYRSSLAVLLGCAVGATMPSLAGRDR